MLDSIDSLTRSGREGRHLVHESARLRVAGVLDNSLVAMGEGSVHNVSDISFILVSGAAGAAHCACRKHRQLARWDDLARER